MKMKFTCSILVGLVGLHVVGCAQDATAPNTIPPAYGGAEIGAGGGIDNPTSSGGNGMGGTAQSSQGGSDSNSTAGGRTQSQSEGGASTGGATSTGGSSSSSVGGDATGGRATGGTSNGTSTGGRAVGGASTGGAATGGRAAGGQSAGGAATGGQSASGSSVGGVATGGAATGGAATGGASSGSCQKFSFFVTSMAAMIRLSGSDKGFGGDLRFGKSDGLSGADAICASIAATALPCAANKTWKAFLSTDSVDAIDRIGSGPWYDRKERLVWNDLSEMSQDRPPNAPAVIKDDLPNEDGTPNHDYDQDGSTTDDDNHDVLTGSGKDGRKIDSDTTAHRCNEWTSTTAAASGTGTGGPGTGFPGGGGMMTNGPMCGHSWPRQGSGINWASSIREGGCGAGINLLESNNGSPGATEATVGSGGGYGAIYCFATTP